MNGEEFVTREAWEAMGVMFGTYITTHEAHILDKYAIEHMMTREEALKAILRSATEKGEPPKSKLPSKLHGHKHPYLTMMMPRPIHSYLERVEKTLGLQWFQIHELVRAYTLDEEAQP